MKQTLNYGRISWAYDDFDPEVPVRPSPFLTFRPVRINGRMRHPSFSDKVCLQLLKHKTENQFPFSEVYKDWIAEGACFDHDLGEGRSFFRWLQKTKKSIAWKLADLKLHPYFTDENAPKHDPDDELAEDLSFAVKPVEVNGRKVKLYLQDEAVLNLINMPYGEDEDFLDLVREYIELRFQLAEWKAPAPPFLDWVKSQAKRPVFVGGQLGLNLR